MGSKSHLLGLERQADRVALNIPARLAPNDWSSLEVRIVNVSRTGFRAECDATLRIGSGISIDVPGIGWVSAQVEWRRSGSIGAKFLQPITLAHCQWAPKQDLRVLTELLIERARQSAGTDADHALRPIIAVGGGRDDG